MCAILATEGTGTLIRWTIDAENRYKAGSGFAWKYEVYEAIRDFLSASAATGCPIDLDNPPGETYEFLFPFQNRRFYGKILLRNDRKRIVVFSAHLAQFTNLSCE
ncbi:MAG: hypothetical protein JWM16_979 [Verrucomicrobiales bacterium]|nr:hypothetical protein [Verrucomicrobiales bacterium]